MNSVTDFTKILALLPFQDWLLPLLSFLFFSLVKLGIYRAAVDELQDGLLQIGQQFGSMGFGFFVVSVFNLNSRLHVMCRGDLKALLFLITVLMIVLMFLYGVSVFTYKAAKYDLSSKKMFGLLPYRYPLWGVSFLAGVFSITSAMRLL